MRRHIYGVPPEFVGERLDVVLSKVTGISRSGAQALIEAGNVWIDGVSAVKASRKLASGEIVEAQLERAETALTPQPTPVPGMDVIYEDHDLIVINKPAGVAAHPSLNFNGPDVLGALMAANRRISEYGPPERKGIVHRLDVGTSGCMVVAKSELAYTGLKQAFRDRTVKKIYHALVQGHPDPLSGTIEAPIVRDHRKQWKMAVGEGGKYALTHYDTLEAMPGATLLTIHLETGRTHQIRVHMAAIHHPCVGDDMYGADAALSARLGLERQWLHAVTLGFEHPRSGEYLEFHSSYPQDLSQALDALRAGVL
ncbi:MAG: RluA family pseudouridine synthase [Actinomycetaceae bacterium]|nr:RluA family pseudouridine synthase [Actinomycetaceae bacterium]MDY5853936.1 RluA family pseudouridine synthase [Arcanobacterium sp.]